MSPQPPIFRADIERNSRGPTKKGATIDARRIPEMIAALEGARVEAVRLGLVEADQ
ncbi:hypothetical protein [Brevundimonas sp.]|uniref:hypothetical protein n=1 Tax=Brevundimonas sp. TaxID=1871086 RepID=UPI00356175E4